MIVEHLDDTAITILAFCVIINSITLLLLMIYVFRGREGKRARFAGRTARRQFGAVPGDRVVPSANGRGATSQEDGGPGFPGGRTGAPPAD